MIDLIKQEAEVRRQKWVALQQAGGSRGLLPQVLRSLGIYGGAQGIWVDKVRTGKLTQDGTGVTVSVLHTGSSYADDLSSDSVLYHYPSTRRPPGRDRSEVEATKAARKLGLPIFVITYPSPGSDKRDVYLGWVEDWDDDAKVFLIAFNSEEQPRLFETVDSDQPFELVGELSGVMRSVAARPGQARFAFRVLQRYGATCAVCGIDVKQVLQAAHIRPKTKRGSDDPGNGLVFCALHHCAFDAELFAFEPATLRIHFRPSGPNADALRITHRDLAHLSRKPHPQALQWAWQRWIQIHGSALT